MPVNRKMNIEHYKGFATVVNFTGSRVECIPDGVVVYFKDDKQNRNGNEIIDVVLVITSFSLDINPVQECEKEWHFQYSKVYMHPRQYPQEYRAHDHIRNSEIFLKDFSEHIYTCQGPDRFYKRKMRIDIEASDISRV